MSRYSKLVLCMAIVLTATAVASAQALGDVARKERTKQKPQAARTYTNEDIPSVDIPKDAPKTDAASSVEAAKSPEGEGDAKADGSKQESKKTAAEQKAALNAEWKDKISGAKSAVASIEREINLMEREQKLRGAVYYADAGNKLRDEKLWADTQKKYQEDLAARQKDLAAANQKLEQAREAARKAGATGVE